LGYKLRLVSKNALEGSMGTFIAEKIQNKTCLSGDFLIY